MVLSVSRLRWLLVILLLRLAVAVPASDWPMWRYDAARSAASPQQLPSQPRLQWMRQLAAPTPAWPAQRDDAGKLSFDASYEPVVAGHTLFVPSMTTDCLLAYDTQSGAERWRFYAEGPVRFAPAVWQEKVFVVSDDGYLYCLDAATGILRWKFRGGPSDRKVLGNERLISPWPARGGPVIKDGVLYFAAGLYPFMGIFIYALDAETGRVIWCNSGSGASYGPQQHPGAASFAGVAPQGYLVAADDTLLVAGGRTVPAAYDRATGQFRYFDVANRSLGNSAGAYTVSALGPWFFNGGAVYRLRDGAPFQKLAAAVFTDDTIISLVNGTLAAYGTQPVTLATDETIGRKGEKNTARTALPERWRATLPAEITAIHLRAGSRLYASGSDGLVAAVEMPRAGKPVAVKWREKVDGHVWRMLAADDRLFVVTLEGALYCFGEQPGKLKRWVLTPEAPPVSEPYVAQAEAFCTGAGVTGGYALVWGAGSGRLAEALAQRGNLRVIVVDPDPAKVAALRARYDAAGRYGQRLAVLTGDPLTMQFPPFLAELITTEDAAVAGFASKERFFRQVFQALRPYGGTAILPIMLADYDTMAAWVTAARLPGAKVGRLGDTLTLTRAGALPGSADWTQQYADAGNSMCSRDTLVQAPLGLLWFGGPSNDKVLPRHGHGPIPQVAGGRLVIEGPDTLSARDVYTGRTLWEAALPGIGKAYDNTEHQPGANALGSNYLSLPDGIYVAYGRKCLRLDPASGKTLAEFTAPATPAGAEPGVWAFITVCDDLLIGTLEPLIFDNERIGQSNWNATASGQLVVLDRFTGKLLWRHAAQYGFRHNAIVAGNGKLFCIDRLAENVLAKLNRLGVPDHSAPKLLALDLRSGEVLWQQEKAFGTWLGYATERDVLIQSGRASRDMLFDEPSNRLVAYRGRDGALQWDNTLGYQGPLILHGDTIISSARGGRQLSLSTGDLVTRAHPLTGTQMPWTYSRSYGCGEVIGSPSLLCFRSGAAGYYDLRGDSGTGNFGGSKSGCTNNMIPADGVLSIPDYTRTCTCSYQLQTSLALVYMPEVETWTWNDFSTPLAPGRVRQVGINFGAPGDRKADDGLLWLDYPSVGGPSPDVPVSVTGEQIAWFRRHSAFFAEKGLPWVAASGLEGAAAIVVTLAKDQPGVARYTVRLHFSEPDGASPGERIFSVTLQEKAVLTHFDPVKEAGAPNTALMREFTDVMIGDQLRVTLIPDAGSTYAPVLCGIEVRLAEK